MENYVKELERVLDMAQYELTVLAPRLTPTYRKSVLATIEEIKAVRLQQQADEPQQTDEPQPPADSPSERRAAGQPYCPECYTFGRVHKKDCPHRDAGMEHHVRSTQ